MRPSVGGGPSVREMGADDVDAVAEIEAESFGTPWSRETFAGLIGRDALTILVLVDAEAGIVGYAVLWCILDQGELANLAVSRAHRERGLGTLLLGHAIALARDRGVSTLYLEVRVSNESAIGLYRRFGFSDVGVRSGYYNRPKEDARIMMLRIGDWEGSPDAMSTPRKGDDDW